MPTEQKYDELRALVIEHIEAMQFNQLNQMFSRRERESFETLAKVVGVQLDPACKRCNDSGWLEPIGPCADGSYISSRPCSCRRGGHEFD